MKTRSKVKNIMSHAGINGSNAAELLKQARRALISLLKASPTLFKMAVEMLKDIRVMDHLVKRKKRSYNNHDGVIYSTSTVPTLDYLSRDMISLQEAAAGHNNLSLTMERSRDGSGPSPTSGGCSSVSFEEVDELADAFISRFYNNIRLEKQRSYRSYQEMLARGT